MMIRRVDASQAGEMEMTMMMGNTNRWEKARNGGKWQRREANKKDCLE